MTSPLGNLRPRKTLVHLLAWVHVPALCLLLAVLIFSAVKGVKLPDLTRDPAAVMKAPAYVGVLSNIGILVWCSAAALCFFTFAVKRSRARGALQGRSFLCSGMLTAALLLDDLFLLHEVVFPRLGVPEVVVYALYGLAVAAHVIRFARRLDTPERVLLLLALGWFGLSVLMDFVPVHSAGMFFAEDGFKFLGIAAWSAYLARVCFLECSASAREPVARRSPERSRA